MGMAKKEEVSKLSQIKQNISKRIASYKVLSLLD